MPRQKNTPKRDAQALVQVSERPKSEEAVSDDEWVPPPLPAMATGASQKPHKQVKMGTTASPSSLVHTEPPPGMESECSFENVKVTATKPSSATAPSGWRTALKKEKEGLTDKKRAKTTIEWGSSGDPFNADDLAVEYVMGAGGDGTGMRGLGVSMHGELMTCARLGAAETAGRAVDIAWSSPGGAEAGVEVGKEGRRRPTLIVTMKFNGKCFRDQGPLYSMHEMARVFAGVLQKQSTKRRCVAGERGFGGERGSPGVCRRVGLYSLRYHSASPSSSTVLSLLAPRDCLPHSHRLWRYTWPLTSPPFPLSIPSLHPPQQSHHRALISQARGGCQTQPTFLLVPFPSQPRRRPQRTGEGAAGGGGLGGGRDGGRGGLRKVGCWMGWGEEGEWGGVCYTG